MTKVKPEGADPREHILTTALTLFAAHGYHATGVRQIAREAGVSLSMISYYFGGKEGIIRAAIERFHAGLAEVIQRTITSQAPFDDAFRDYVRGVVAMYRAQPDLIRVGLLQMPLGTDVVKEIKGRHLSELVPKILERVQDVLGDRGGEGLPPFEILLPAVGMFIASHFLLKPLMEHIRGATFDESFYETYPEWIADVLLWGLHGPAASPDAPADPTDRTN